jgi:hypothetical protein
LQKNGGQKDGFIFLPTIFLQSNSMNLNCPVCRAENTTGPACRRCRADLSLIMAVEARRDHHVATARSAMRDGRFDDALDELSKAEELHSAADIRQMRACVYLLAGDFPAALAEHAAVGRP